MQPGDAIRQINALLRYYLHIENPDAMSDEAWAMAYNELVWVRNEEAKANTR